MQGIVKSHNHIFVNKTQELLLKASILKGDQALDAWREWKEIINLEQHMDHGSFRLLPLLYRNLKAHQISDPLMDRLKGVYRQTWYKNQKLFHDTGQILNRLHQAGVKTMVTKGAALSILTYQDIGVRPMSDVDIVVSYSQVKEAMKVLNRMGLESTYYPESSETLKYRISLQYKSKSGDEFDLHWFPYIELDRDKLAADIWKESIPVTLGKEKTTALCPTDCLVHVIIHGIWWNPEPPIRWVADAMSIINSPSNDLDWDRFVDIVKINRISLRMKSALSYLIKEFHADIPTKTIKALNKMPTSINERLVYAYSLMDPKRISAKAGHIPILFMEFLQTGIRKGFITSIFHFPRYLKYLYRFEKLSDVYIYLGSALKRRVFRLLLSKTTERKQEC